MAYTLFADSDKAFSKRGTVDSVDKAHTVPDFLLFPGRKFLSVDEDFSPEGVLCFPFRADFQQSFVTNRETHFLRDFSTQKPLKSTFINSTQILEFPE